MHVGAPAGEVGWCGELHYLSGARVPLLLLSREESRSHVHVQHETGEAKIWLEPEIAIAQNYGLSPARLAAALRLVQGHENEIRTAWQNALRWLK